MLEKKRARVVEERPARKAPLTDGEARKLLRRVDRVIVARGRKIEEARAARLPLASLKGPTGNYRAPMVLRGKTLLVGFNEEALLDLL